MAMPTFTMRQLLEAGVHFGHHTRRWNPKMEPYMFGVRNGSISSTSPRPCRCCDQALLQVREVVVQRRPRAVRRHQAAAAEPIADAAKRCGQYYVNHRWLGGTLTNWQTISASIKRLRELEERLKGDVVGLTKKELLDLTRERDKLERSLGGIKEMGGTPDMLFVIDTNKEAIAIQEARKLDIPVVAMLDSNSDPDGIAYPIPGNDDAVRAISLYCDLLSGAVLDGIRAEIAASGGDVGELSEPPADEVPAADTGEAGAEATPAAKHFPPARIPRREVIAGARHPVARLSCGRGRPPLMIMSGGAASRHPTTSLMRTEQDMAEITASLVKELREKTGAGMMDCKKALGEVAGDLEKAIDWLRTKGLSTAAKKADRVAAEGLVGVRRQRHARRRRRGQRRDRLRRPQRHVPEVRRRRREDRARQRRRPGQGRGRALSRHRPRRAGRAHRPDRHHRREHVAAPRRHAVGLRRRRRQLRAQRGGARSRQDRRAGGARSRPATRPSSRRSPSSSPCTWPSANPSR